MTIAEATFTDFLRNPRTITDRVADGDVILRRRDDEDLLLTTASRAAAEAESFSVVSRLISAALEDEVVRGRIAGRSPLPWTRFLPDGERREFYDELFACVLGSLELKTMVPVARLLDEWRATAAIHADPDLAARLRRPVVADEGPIPRPPSPR
jgi:hypothetical protein